MGPDGVRGVKMDRVCRSDVRVSAMHSDHSALPIIKAGATVAAIALVVFAIACAVLAAPLETGVRDITWDVIHISIVAFAGALGLCIGSAFVAWRERRPHHADAA